MPDYHLYQTNFEGDFLTGVTFVLKDDEAAFAKAREICQNCNVEVWKGMIKLAVFRNEDLSPRDHSGQQSSFDFP